MRKLIKFTCGNIMATFTSIALLVYFGSQLKGGNPGAIILIAIVFFTWMVYTAVSVITLLGIRRD